MTKYREPWVWVILWFVLLTVFVIFKVFYVVAIFAYAGVLMAIIHNLSKKVKP